VAKRPNNGMVQRVKLRSNGRILKGFREYYWFDLCILHGLRAEDEATIGFPRENMR